MQLNNANLKSMHDVYLSLQLWSSYLSFIWKNFVVGGGGSAEVFRLHRLQNGALDQLIYRYLSSYSSLTIGDQRCI